MTEPLHDPQPRLTVQLPDLVMAIHATGPDAEAEVRQLCSGHLPRVGERYVLVCTAVRAGSNEMTVQFQLASLEEDADV